MHIKTLSLNKIVSNAYWDTLAQAITVGFSAALPKYFTFLLCHPCRELKRLAIPLFNGSAHTCPGFDTVDAPSFSIDKLAGSAASDRDKGLQREIS